MKALPEFKDIAFQPQFGERVKFDCILTRHSHWKDGDNWITLTWEPSIECCGVMREGLFLGWRILVNGEIFYGPEDGRKFKPSDYLRVALICQNERTSPVYVPANSLKFLYSLNK